MSLPGIASQGKVLVHILKVRTKILCFSARKLNITYLHKAFSGLSFRIVFAQNHVL